MTTVYYWRVKCTTDDTYEYVWHYEEPTVCPKKNATHSIDASKTTVVDKIEENMMKVQEESTPTGGHFKCECMVIDIAANETKVQDISWVYPVSVFTIFFTTTADHEGDLIKVEAGPDTVVGTITSDVSASDTVINVSSTVIDNIDIGFVASITDGVNTDDLGYVTDIDKIVNTIMDNKILQLSKKDHINLNKKESIEFIKIVCLVNNLIIQARKYNKKYIIYNAKPPFYPYELHNVLRRNNFEFSVYDKREPAPAPYTGMVGYMYYTIMI
jgi:hypothetical protein